MIQQMKLNQRRSSTAVALLVFAAVLCIHGLIAPFLWGVDDMDLEEEMIDYDAQLHRYLLQTLDESHLMEQFDEYPSEEIQEIAQNESPIGTNDQSVLSTLTAYNLEDAIREADTFKFTFAVMIYDPTSDKFLGYYHQDHLWRSSFQKLQSSMGGLAFILRKAFPERFTPTSEELAIAISSGDYPHVHLPRIPHTTGVAPVLHFGSVFRDTNLFSNMIAMPMPGPHLSCFVEWAEFGRVCGALRPMHGEIPNGELAFGKELEVAGREGLEWDKLKPQLIWRGTDFSYLSLLIRPRLSQPLSNHIEQSIDQRTAELTDKQSKMAAATEVLREHYNELLPRWKGVLLTAEAELAANNQTLPWADIKFSTYLSGGLKRTLGSEKYRKFEEIGIAVGNYMSLEEMAYYRYYIDIGGGGGTTWTGTHSKLPMPGLLFHHITPTMDYFHSRIKPWQHFVPVAPDLSDLKDKFDWAESHPDQAMKIADQATDFMRHLGKPEGFQQIYDEDFIEPLRRILDAYQPVSSTNAGKTWRDVIDASKMVHVLECNGMISGRSSCDLAGGELVEQWQRRGKYA